MASACCPRQGTSGNEGGEKHSWSQGTSAGQGGGSDSGSRKPLSVFKRKRCGQIYVWADDSGTTMERGF